MRRLLVVATSAIALSVTAAFAGEVKGPPGDLADPVHNTNTTAAPANANSACAFSGLNDFDGEEGQNVSIVQTAADSWKLYPFPKGFVGTACRGGGPKSAG
jgi:hypothetical protein